MTSLNPLALTYETVLRALTTPPEKPLTLSSLAAAGGKDKSTLRRALPAMREAGLLGPGPDFTLADAGRAALALLDGGGGGGEAAEDANAVRAPAGYAALHHQLIVPDHLNPREAFDEAALEELAGSIKANGLLQNLVVRPAGPMEGYGQPMHRLVAGERRWRAVDLLIRRGDWPADRPLPVHIVDLDDTGHAVIALLENLQRKDLKPLEEARAFKRLVEHHGFKTADIAGKINATQRLVQQRLQLLELDANDQLRLDEGKLNLEQARQILAARPKPFNLPAEQALMLVEIAYRVLKAHETITYQAVPIGDPGGDTTLAALSKASLARFAADWKTGQLTVSLDYCARRALAEVTGIADPDTGELAGAGINLRVTTGALPAEGQNFVTPWLNEPYAFDEGRVRELERRKIDATARAEAAKARNAQVADAKKAARALELGLKNGAMTTAGGELKAAMDALGVVLPLRLVNSAIEDARGHVVASASYYGHGIDQDARAPLLRLVALAVNAALGFPEAPPAEDLQADAGPVDDDTFDQDDDDEGECEICGQPIVGGDCPDCAAEDAGDTGDDDEIHPAARRLVEPA